jgi:hypothetical protein
MYEKFKKLINRFFLFILSLPGAFIILAPIFLLYGGYLLLSSNGRRKLKKYFLSIINFLNLFKTREGRRQSWVLIKNFWNGRN